jgi:hypothetical protein
VTYDPMTHPMILFAFARRGEWFRPFFRSGRASIASTALIALVGTFSATMAKSETSMTERDKVSVHIKRHELLAATDLVVMIIPYPTFFRVSVDEGQLPNVSCVYEIKSGYGPTFEEVIDLIERSGIELDDGPNAGADLRVGLIFRNSGEVVQQLYFDDKGGKEKVRGIFNNRKVFASANLPNQLRSFLTHPDVTLIKNRRNICPHS